MLPARPLLAVWAGVSSQTRLPRPPSPPAVPPHSKLGPPLDLEKKSQLLSICLHSVLALPLLDVLERHTCLFLEPPNIQVRPGARGPSRRRPLGGASSSAAAHASEGSWCRWAPAACQALGLPPQQQLGELKGAPQAPRELTASTQGLCSDGLQWRVGWAISAAPSLPEPAWPGKRRDWGPRVGDPRIGTSCVACPDYCRVRV